jgi:hypothetical protein
MTTEEMPYLFQMKLACPTCGQAMRHNCYTAVKHEKFDRKCKGCKTVWAVDRKFAGCKNGAMVNVLEWEEQL